MASFKIFRDWLSTRHIGPDEVKIEPILKDGYQLFGYMYACSMEGLCTTATLKAAYQRNGLKNTGRRDDAIRYLINRQLIITEKRGMITNKMELTGKLSREYKIELSKDDWDLYRENLLELAAKLENGFISALNPIDILKDMNKQRKGFKLMSDALVFLPGMTKHAGKKLQVYVYLALATVYAKQTTGLHDNSFTGIKINMYKGEVLNGPALISTRLGMHKKTVQRILGELEAEKLISTRGITFGHSKIIKVLAYAEEYKPGKRKKKPKKP